MIYQYNIKNNFNVEDFRSITLHFLDNSPCDVMNLQGRSWKLHFCRFRPPEGNNAPITLQRTSCLPACVRNGGWPYQWFVHAIMFTQLLSHEFLISCLLVSIANEQMACLSESGFRIASFVHGKLCGRVWDGATKDINWANWLHLFYVASLIGDIKWRNSY
jgi:hypothetical protein